MAKKPLIDLRAKNIFYTDKDQTIKLKYFKKSNMTLEVAVFENEKHIRDSVIAFAHLPKSVKSIIKPL